MNFIFFVFFLFLLLWGGEQRLKGGLKRGLKGGLKGDFKVALKGSLRGASRGLQGMNFVFFVFNPPKAFSCGFLLLVGW